MGASFFALLFLPLMLLLVPFSPIFKLFDLLTPNWLSFLLDFPFGSWFDGVLRDLSTNQEFLEWFAGTSFGQWLLEFVANHLVG